MSDRIAEIEAKMGKLLHSLELHNRQVQLHQQQIQALMREKSSLQDAQDQAMWLGDA